MGVTLVVGTGGRSYVFFFSQKEENHEAGEKLLLKTFVENDIQII